MAFSFAMPNFPIFKGGAWVVEAKGKNRIETMTFGITHSGTSLALQRARRLRTNQTTAEKILWEKLRAKRFHGIKFRRQAPIGIYIVDFMCPQKRLVVEIDGGTHLEEGAADYDEKREAYLRSRGLKVIRFMNGDVRTNLEWVLMRIHEECFL